MNTNVAKDRLTAGIQLAAIELECEPKRLIDVLKRFGIIETATSLCLCRVRDSVLTRARVLPENHPIRNELETLANSLLKQAESATKAQRHGSSRTTSYRRNG